MTVPRLVRPTWIRCLPHRISTDPRPPAGPVQGGFDDRLVRREPADLIAFLLQPAAQLAKEGEAVGPDTQANHVLALVDRLQLLAKEAPRACHFGEGASFASSWRRS